jgi:hypothetical protein
MYLIFVKYKFDNQGEGIEWEERRVRDNVLFGWYSEFWGI